MRTRQVHTSSDSALSAALIHRSVLLHEAIEQLSIKPGDTVVDATLGGAGHARKIAMQLDTRGTFVGFDLDHDAIVRAEVALKNAKPKIYCIEDNFKNIAQRLGERGIEAVDKVLFDLGWSSFQLEAGRGFSFLKDEPLMMTYSKNGDESTLTAEKIVNEWEESSIADVIYGWGEERYARRIARAIVEYRQVKPVKTTFELAEIVKAAVPRSYRNGRLHPATKTFQALRIAVNDELRVLQEGIRGAWHLLNQKGRIAVITFHSIEDRVVKKLFAEFEKEGGERITRAPIKPSQEEIASNPRSRSAKLRVIEKNTYEFHKKDK
ncbi:MAG TPA: 16S rRNA (cytosine(1402)-N(4))-methyltransferase RsmH [Candidatus Paceibacterota bacterium]|nr:16S rRNA (cytosine(1402)-N(4))-methyltransferase RsmH [Candidatus Paceibacterota bacterium]